MRRACLLVISLVVVAAGLAVTTTPASAASSYAAQSSRYERSVTYWANVNRTDRNRSSVKASSCVDKWAERWARKMASSGSLTHYFSKEYKSMMRECHLRSADENIAKGFSDGKSVTKAWMNSSGHRANILRSNYKLIGVGAVKDSKGRWWVSQVFGQRR